MDLSGRHISVPPVTTLRFGPGESCNGLWVRVRTNMDQLQLYSMSRKVNSDDLAERLEGADEISAYLVAWNECDAVLDADGEPVIDKDGSPEATPAPCDERGWVSRNPFVRMAIVQKWIDCLGGSFAPDPKPSTRSSNGKRSARELSATTAA